jgi:hypothetical protein
VTRSSPACSEPISLVSVSTDRFYHRSRASTDAPAAVRLDRLNRTGGKWTLIGLLCAALAVAVVSVPASASSGTAHIAKKKCKKSKSAVAAKKKCKKKQAAPPPIVTPPSGGGTTTTTPPADADSDGVPDSSDNCVNVANSDQSDFDADGKGDACDACPATANPGTQSCPASLIGLSTPAQICIGTTTAAGTVTLGETAAEDTFVELSTSPGDITIPAGGVTVPTGQTSANFDMTGVMTDPDVTITATLDTTSLTSHTAVANSLC